MEVAHARSLTAAVPGARFIIHHRLVLWDISFFVVSLFALAVRLDLVIALLLCIGIRILHCMGIGSDC